MENGITMLGHSILIGIFAYFIMVILSVSDKKKTDRSILIGSVVCAYMVTFGHGLPSSSTLNSNIF
jgi:hypothetical protein